MSGTAGSVGNDQEASVVSYRDGGIAGADAAPDENEFGEPPCATPVDIGWNPQPDAAKSGDDFVSSAHDEIAPRKAGGSASANAGTGTAQPGSDVSPQASLGGEKRWNILVEQIRKENLSLAATLMKAKERDWSEGRLFLSFGSEYEASVAKNEADTIRRTAAAAGMPPFTLEVATTGEGEQPEEEVWSRRVELVRRVFRGQVMKG